MDVRNQDWEHGEVESRAAVQVIDLEAKSAGVQCFLYRRPLSCCALRCLLQSTLCPLAFTETKIYVAFSSLPIYFYFTLELLQYQGDSPQVLKPSKISP